MTHKPPQGIDRTGAKMSECPHKELKKQMVGEFVYYVCECGQKFRIEAWDGKVSVLAPPDPRKDLALEAKLEEAKWWYETHIRPWRADDLDMEDVAQKRIAELEQRLAEMRGAKR